MARETCRERRRQSRRPRERRTDTDGRRLGRAGLETRKHAERDKQRETNSEQERARERQGCAMARTD